MFAKNFLLFLFYGCRDLNESWLSQYLFVVYLFGLAVILCIVLGCIFRLRGRLVGKSRLRIYYKIVERRHSFPFLNYLQKHRIVKLGVYLGGDLVSNCALLKYVFIDNNKIEIKLFYMTYNMKKSIFHFFGRVIMS